MVRNSSNTEGKGKTGGNPEIAPLTMERVVEYFGNKKLEDVAGKLSTATDLHEVAMKIAAEDAKKTGKDKTLLEQQYSQDILKLGEEAEKIKKTLLEKTTFLGKFWDMLKTGARKTINVMKSVLGNRWVQAGIIVGILIFGYAYWHQIMSAVHTTTGLLVGKAREILGTAPVIPGGTEIAEGLRETAEGTGGLLPSPAEIGAHVPLDLDARINISPMAP